MKIFAIAINTFKETIRDKILYNLLVFALLIIIASMLLQELTISQQIKIVKDVCLGSISIFGVLIAVFIGIGLVSREIERKTIYTIVSKPIHRYQFLLGKFLGLLITLAINVGIMTLTLATVVYIIEGTMGGSMYIAVYLIFLELILITGIALFFSTFTTPTLSAIFTLAIFLIGRMAVDIKYFGGKSKSIIIQKLSSALYDILPNLQNYNVRELAVYNEPISSYYILWVTGALLIWTTIFLILASLIFERRDFK